MRPRRPAWFYWVPALVWATVIFVLSAQPWLPGPPGPLSDKHAHAVTFGILALACLFGLTGGRWAAISPSRVALAVLLSILYGVSDEWHQAYVPGRTPDGGDVLADATGAALAAVAAWACAILLRRRDPSA